MAYAPSQDSDTKTASSQASSSGSKPATTPSATCSLPKKANFYSIFEVSFLSEVLQAVTFILKEDSPKHATRDEQTKEYYYNGTVASLIYFTLFVIFGINFNYF